MMMMDTMDAASQQSQPMDVAPAVAVAATSVGSAALVDFTATMVSMAATAEAETGTSESNNNHIDMADYKEHRKNKKKKREKREREGREGKEHRHHKHREHREHREHRRHRDRDRDRERESHHHHHQHHQHHHHPNSSQHSTSASSSPSSASTTPSATIEYVGGSASASPSYLGAAGGGGGVGGATGSGGGATTTYPHNLKIRFLLSGVRLHLETLSMFYFLYSTALSRITILGLGHHLFLPIPGFYFGNSLEELSGLRNQENVLHVSGIKREIRIEFKKKRELFALLDYRRNRTPVYPIQILYLILILLVAEKLNPFLYFLQMTDLFSDFFSRPLRIFF